MRGSDNIEDQLHMIHECARGILQERPLIDAWFDAKGNLSIKNNGLPGIFVIEISGEEADMPLKKGKSKGA